MVFFILLIPIMLLFGCESSKGDDVNGEDTTPAGTSGEISDPVISPASGELVTLSSITISCATSAAAIYYTTDGSEPSESSTCYSNDTKPILYGDTTIRAIAIDHVAGKQSKVVSASYTTTPVLADFELVLEPGMRWNYKYTYSHYVGYSYFGDESFSTTYNFSIVVGEEETIDGISAYKLYAFRDDGGSYSLKWTHLAIQDHKLLGSKDGNDFTVLFDSMLGLWAGECFFLDFNESSNSEPNQMSATMVGTEATVSYGWNIEDNDSAYYPDTGTIYDPDAWSMHSDKSESYKSGFAPAGYETSDGYSDYYETSSDTYTVTLISQSSGEDYSSYSYDKTIATTDIQTFNMDSENEKIKVNLDSSAKYIVYVDFITAGYDAKISVQNGGYTYLITNRNDSTGTEEIYKTDVFCDGTMFITVSDVGGKSDGQYRIAVIPIIKAVTDSSAYGYVTTTTPTTINSYNSYSTLDGNAISFDASMSTGTNYYFFIIPKSDTIDMAGTTLVKDGTDWLFVNKVNMNGAGQPEVFYDSLGLSPNCITVYEMDLNAADYIFGMGVY